MSMRLVAGASDRAGGDNGRRVPDCVLHKGTVRLLAILQCTSCTNVAVLNAGKSVISKDTELVVHLLRA